MCQKTSRKGLKRGSVQVLPGYQDHQVVFYVNIVAAHVHIVPGVHRILWAGIKHGQITADSPE